MNWIGVRKRRLRNLLWCALLLLGVSSVSRAEIQWTEPGARVHLYFFWSSRCPYCNAAHPEIEALVQSRSWLLLHDLELSRHPENGRRYRAMAAELGEPANSVPALLFCGVMQLGWGEGAAASLARRLDDCRQPLLQGTDGSDSN